jgi:hypothetical protein
MPSLVPNSSSPLDFEALGDHLVGSSRRETNILKENLQDMVVYHVVVIGHNVIGVHRDGMASPVNSISNPFYSKLH